MVKHEKKNALNPNVLKPTATIKPSNAKITSPIFNEKDLDKILANKSVPPVLTP